MSSLGLVAVENIADMFWVLLLLFCRTKLSVAQAKECVQTVGISEALNVVKREGIAIVDVTDESEESWQSLASQLPVRIFGDSMISQPMVAGVHVEHRDTKAPISLVNQPLLPHTDGYVYGDHGPDYILLLVESQSESGGESFVVDGEKVFERLDEKSKEKAMEVGFDQTERSPPGIANGREMRGPLVRRTDEGRFWWRRQVSVQAISESNGDVTVGGNGSEPLHSYQSLWNTTSDNSDGDFGLLETMDAAIQLESRDTARFKVPKGHALLLDNYRCLHGRERFAGDTERRLWRVWVWTAASLGLPPGIPQVASPLHADSIVDT